MTTSEEWRITSVEVLGLFGVFNHSISLDNPDRVTIIHGPNGFGKTMVLSMVHAFISGSYGVFHRVPFKVFELNTHNGVRVLLKQEVSEEGRSGKSQERNRQVAFEIHGVGETQAGTLREVTPRVPLHVLREIDQVVPAPFRLNGSLWLNPHTGEHLELQDVVLRFPQVQRMPAYRRYARPSASELDPVREHLSSYFIHTKRLTSASPSKGRSYWFEDGETDVMGEEPVLSVDRFSRELAQLIEEKLADYGKHSQQLDRTFPVRLVEFLREKRAPLEPDLILAELAELDQRRQNLTRIGFLDAESVLENLGENDVLSAKEALTIYVQDMRAKLGVFDDIERRVTLFMDIVNARFTFKRLEVNRRSGFVVRPVSASIDSAPTISLPDLSSGEQHELVVLSELLFKVPPGALILIDEPELSLHSAWQATFLDDLIGILEVNNARALVATHSPLIIGERWDLTQALQEPLA